LSLFKKIADSYEKNKPFVAYNKPNETLLSGFFLSNDTLQKNTDFNASGFVFAPFNEDEDAIIFPLEQSECINEDLYFMDTFLESKSVLDNPDVTLKEKHIEIVAKAIAKIKEQNCKKIVISRFEEIQLSSFDLLAVFKSLLHYYRNAFVYVWFHPKVGLWLGATPETLLHVSENTFQTMSLAGTQLFNENKNPIWKSKELEEQILVTNFIKKQLQPISSYLKINNTETVRAGTLLHLRTRVEGQLKKNISLENLIRAIHPTPAVCGLPREESKKFILKNESYNRDFYTGFLGELNLSNGKNDKQRSILFVNLRCMSIASNVAKIYAGGGITKDSDPEKEWLETVAKSNTMKQVL
jgi:isochorismate synthase